MKTPGLVVPPLTPFNKDLNVDFDVLEHEVDYIIEDCGAMMVSAAGVETTEYHFLSFEDRCELIRRTVEFVDGRVPAVVGVSHANVKTAIELSQMAQDLEAHALQILAPLRPFGGAPTLDDLISYYEAISDETDLPIMLYLNPGPGAEVNPFWALELAKLDRVKYVKESSRDLARVSRLIEEIDHGGHAQYFTTMQMLLASIQLGGSGATMPPPGAYIANAIINAFNAGDHTEAARLQRQFALWPARWMSYGLAPALKAAMEVVGMPLGDPYPPFKPVSDGDKAAMREYLQGTYLFENAHQEVMRARAA
ncbi:MAG: 4-hydroxy-tetrahydrodipicolinate synthase [Alphaproteobacteria bacterium MarineAlpha11_Bin1]|nr:MAG: 4-hydroxy-tetrahydrodipicolinate synthase [Alphaproteobacteria bacterium MarineAlpha11_Bin1]|tara:strand:+ start:10805 stop:11731 length:927 start_codon:yes stop_codon:yes gene_type:complete